MAENEKRISELEKHQAVQDVHLRNVSKDIIDIRKFVSNHLPHQIADVRAFFESQFKTVFTKIKSFETKDTQKKAVSEFLTNVVKIVTTFGIAILTIIQILSYLKV